MRPQCSWVMNKFSTEFRCNLKIMMRRYVKLNCHWPKPVHQIAKLPTTRTEHSDRAALRRRSISKHKFWNENRVCPVFETKSLVEACLSNAPWLKTCTSWLNGFCAHCKFLLSTKKRRKAPQLVSESARTLHGGRTNRCNAREEWSQRDTMRSPLQTFTRWCLRWDRYLGDAAIKQHVWNWGSHHLTWSFHFLPS